MYHFLSGYTAKVAGTEVGVTEPQATFSSCFGAPFMPLHPARYAEMLGKRIEKDGARIWLVNTGWSGGGYGVGERMKLRYTRAMIGAAMRGELDDITMAENKNFGLKFPTTCPGVPNDILTPRETWKNGADYDTAAHHLARLFQKNFEQFAAEASETICEAAPLA
jgi:phosphoenolpyruvate carboxykinase (ATP)